ncbi:MAG: T9SS type A sorting domain-containing protein [Flavobacteriales bacterium]|nr:T9SS type A sorting domain-containing protein [Flavobacteriales bacterium]
MTFDLYLQTSSSNYYLKEYLVKISGPDGSATFMTNDSITALTVNQWRGYEIPIAEGSWELQSGSWAGLMNFVSEVRLELEFIDGTGETTFLDNFCLNAPISTAVGPIASAGEPIVYPNPFSGTITVQCASEGPHNLRVVDTTGRIVHEQRVLNTVGIDLSRLPPGAYAALVWQDRERIHRTTLIKQ